MWLDQVLDRVKRKWLKRVKAEKKSLYTLEQKDMATTIQTLPENRSKHVISARQPKVNLQLVIGLVRPYGLEKAAARRAVQSQEEVNTVRGWDFGTFEMSNHQVFMSSDMNTAVITFDADGLINFDDGEQNVPYATRASQTWVNENGEWKVMHSHWSPRTNSQGIPQAN